MVTWQGRYDQEMRGFADAIYRRWIYEAVMFAYIDIPQPTMIEIIVGYNPQRLLPHPHAFPNTGRWSDSRNNPLADIQEFIRDIMLGDAFLKPIFPPIFPAFDYEESKPVDFGAGTGRRETPIRLENVRLSYPHLKPPEVVTFSGADYAAAEARLLALMAEPYVTSIYIDFADVYGDLPGRINFDEMLADARKTHYSHVPFVPSDEPVKQNGRSAAYLKHDPSKKKGRRR